MIAGDGCFMEGISHEAASLAGHLGLGRLLAFYDDNHITIDGPTELAYDDNVPERFEAYGWRVRNLGEMANDVDGLEAAIREALDAPADGPEAKPTLLVLRSHIGWPSPKLTDTAEAHGVALRRRGDRGHQEDPRPADGPDVLGPRRGARLLPPGDRPRRRAPRRLERALRGLAGRPRRLGRRPGRARAGRLGGRPAVLRRRYPAGHPACHQQVHRRHRGQAARACWRARPT